MKKAILLTMLILGTALVAAPGASARHLECGADGALVDGGCYQYCYNANVGYETRCYYCEVWVRDVGGFWCNPV